MSFFMMGFQFMPGGLDFRDKLALKNYAESLPVKITALKVSNEKKQGWFAIPHVDFGLDALYGLDESAGDIDSDDLQF